jgi:exodeoxyribonuclease V beta subunit
MSLNLLTLPLSGRQVIEASAGTGKTFTLAALYVRLVLGHGRDAKGLQPAHILVMTFTDAATAELRERIRLRLHEAALWFDAQVAGRNCKPDPFLNDLAKAFTPEQWAQCAAQLHLAAQSMDEAAIYTIHGWSRRMLSSFALHSRDLFEQTHLDNPAELLHELVNDHWRRWFYPLDLPQQKILKTLLGGDPKALLKDLKTRWQTLDRQPQPSDAPAPPAPPAPTQVLAMHGEWLNTEQALVVAAKQACLAALGKELVGILVAAQAAKKMKGSRADLFANWVNELQAWSQPDADIRAETLQRFTLSNLQDKGWSEAAEHPVFAHIEALCQHQTTEPASKDGLLDHAAHEVRQQYQQTKLQLSVFDFQDLLQRLHTALYDDEGQMAAAIRDQYPVAMVDEFQDTDPWQYQSLNRIYHPSHVQDTHALVMIGDPKQAIYSFRGADLRTYLEARTQALELNPQALHSLDSNFRSTPALVQAVNHVFDAIEQPFHSALGKIEFTKVNSRSDAIPLSNAQGKALPPLTVWHLLPPDNAKHWSAPLQLQHMSQGFAAQMVALLHQHPEVQPRDMAVLVRTHVQAKAMQKALQKLGLPSVFMSDHANVFQSEEAQDLWRVLRAISAPRQTAWLRSAVACRIWGLDMPQLQAFLQNDAMTDALAESCQRWLQQWQFQGVLPMLYSWLHEQHIATRLLALPDGERRLTNLLHLGELLQNASQGLQGPAALLQHLADRLQSSSDSPEAQKMRLETDDQCVQIVTYHKSKGLEYPLVFVPFLGSFKKPPKDDAKEAVDAEDEEAQEPDITESNVDEDMRLLYVALTRAKRAMWLGVSSHRDSLAGQKGKDLRLSAVSRLLKRESHADLADRLKNTWGGCEHIAIQTLPSPNGQHYQAPRSTALPQPALLPQRQNHQRWWTASFSSLTRGLEAGTPHEEALLDADMDAQSLSPTPVPPSSSSNIFTWQKFPAGAQYGTLLHDLLQYQGEQAWPLANASATEQDLAWQQLLQRKADWLHLPSDAQALLQPWLRTIVSTALPLQAADAPTQSLGSPLVLQTLAANALWAEMEFNLPVGQLSSNELDAHIQRYVLPGFERPALQNNVLQGMLSGFMDLVLQHDGRYWVLDYKSNLLADYQAQHLSAAILAKRYEVQYVLYTLALHRLLQSRLPNYHYEQHMGGAVYLFLRGVDTPSAGVHCLRPPWALIDLLDQRFAKALP